MMYNQTAAKGSVDIIENIIQKKKNCTCILTETLTQGTKIGPEGVEGGMTFHLMVLFHHTKLGYRKFNYADSTVWTSIN